MSEKSYSFLPYMGKHYTDSQMTARSAEFHSWLDRRRSVRHFSGEPVPREVMENIVKAASTAPSGAHMQPWTFCLVSNAELKSRIRELAQRQEKKNYESRMSSRWLADLKPLGTTPQKEFLDSAPWLVVVMKQLYRIGENGEKLPNYYVNQSVGIAVGFLLAAVHNAGLAALTHTPSPMGFLARALDRPENERPYMLIPVGFSAPDAMVPDLNRKELADIAVFYE